MRTERLTIAVPGHLSVSAVLVAPKQARACYVMAHGAGAGMEHPFMAAVAAGLAERGVATLRYQFPFMEQGSKRPDRSAVAYATVRAAAAAAARLMPNVPIIAGGKSFGGRMTSQAEAETPMEGVRGLAFFGFPLHPAKKPSDERARHLADVQIPMFFLQGTRDALADTAVLLPAIERLGARATLKLIEDADHSFHVPARSGRTDGEVLEGALHDLEEWVDTLVRHGPR